MKDPEEDDDESFEGEVEESSYILVADKDSETNIFTEREE